MDCAFPPIRADRMGLASTASFRSFLGIAKEILFLDSSLLETVPDIVRQREKEFTLKFNWKCTGGIGKVKARHLTATNNENRFFAAQQFRCVFAEFSDSCKDHCSHPSVNNIAESNGCQQSIRNLTLSDFCLRF